jgi:hypothetical protein
MTVKFVVSNQGRPGVQTPYNANFVSELKALVPTAKWSSGARTWFYDEKFYPNQETFQTVRITWKDMYRSNPTIDGVQLAYVSRDNWQWRNNCSVLFKVILNDLEAGGSRNNPGLYGNLKIEAKIRPNADISPKPDKVVIMENGTSVNPLEKFSTEELIAELDRREEA